MAILVKIESDAQLSYKLSLLLEKTAYLLVYHGSRDSRPQDEMLRIAESVRQKLGEQLVSSKRQRVEVLKDDDRENQRSRWGSQITDQSQALVYTAALELAPLPLEGAIAQLIPFLYQQEITELRVMPLFLLPGVHVREDIPEAIAKAQAETENKVKISLCSYIGQSPLMAEKLKTLFSDSENSAKIIVSHGSRRVGGNQPIENLAQQLGVSAAYWSVSPSLSEQAISLVKGGMKTIEIKPYFLFPGGITDAIAEEVQSLAVQYPKVQFSLGSPLNHGLSLIEIIVHEITKPISNQ